MSKTKQVLTKILKPSARYPWWLDVFWFMVFGFWFWIPLLYDLFTWTSPFLPIHPDPNTYNCGGPGFVDFGCTGGREAIMANIFGITFSLM
ncbi:MAG TPA: hypothetical protein V6C72_18440, partial [Chroococcales cyanobacterium]